VTFQARGAAGGEVVTFSAAGAAETPFTLTNAWKAYSISLVGVAYNTDLDGVDSASSGRSRHQRPPAVPSPSSSTTFSSANSRSQRQLLAALRPSKVDGRAAGFNFCWLCEVH